MENKPIKFRHWSGKYVYVRNRVKVALWRMLASYNKGYAPMEVIK